jgi:beta-lactam-binding protein with PASTA domain
MQNFISFIKSKQFYIHLGLIIVLIVLIFFILIKWLAAYTDHGKFVYVPDFKGQTIRDLDKFIEAKDVSYKIIDSIYHPEEKTGIVLRQDPESNVKVKHNRTIYLYVTRLTPPGIKMPKLVDRSERQARLILLTYGLKIGRLIEKSADCNGCVLVQLNDGKEIAEGTEIKKGSVVDLIVGKKDSFYDASMDSTGLEDKKNENVHE